MGDLVHIPFEALPPEVFPAYFHFLRGDEHVGTVRVDGPDSWTPSDAPLALATSVRAEWGDGEVCVVDHDGVRWLTDES